MRSKMKCKPMFNGLNLSVNLLKTTLVFYKCITRKV
jgi:hypothetical protein